MLSDEGLIHWLMRIDDNDETQRLLEWLALSFPQEKGGGKLSGGSREREFGSPAFRQPMDTWDWMDGFLALN